ncbi:transporter RarD family, DMT superfamily protein [Roseobacter cerasinus]|uniref:Transporter RarD family, DMT superfamily protein n=1 Tax=Roseobacter cerasinus TaxID=2602289 RepID=A0A640VNM3_9RHOB|nr:DMT family transporter [Roseobacter cerasinus]GFE49639.1 transporter RarD family, DMT superfamily protein [Roseobacter cerasinus]
MAQDLTEHRPGRAIALKLCAVFLFMVMAAIIKGVSGAVPPGQAVFFRSLFAIPIIALWLAQRGQLRDGLIPSNLMGHVWRGVFGTSAMALTFAGLGLLPLPEVTAIGYATPLFAVIFAAMFLGERIRLIRISAVTLGLVGVMIVIAPRLSVGADDISRAATIGAGMVLTAAILRALVQIHVRRLVQTDHTAAIVFYFSATASGLALLSAPIGWVIDHPAFVWVWPERAVVLWLITAGLIGGVAQIMVTSSYRFGSASMLAPFDYASMIFAGIIGYVAFNEVPTGPIILGASLVIAGGILIIWREQQLGVDRSKSKPNQSPPGTP